MTTSPWTEEHTTHPLKADAEGTVLDVLLRALASMHVPRARICTFLRMTPPQKDGVKCAACAVRFQRFSISFLDPLYAATMMSSAVTNISLSSPGFLAKRLLGD